MDLVLFIGHLIIVDKVHILDDAHLLLLSSKSSSIVIIEGFRQRIGHVVIKTPRRKCQDSILYEALYCALADRMALSYRVYAPSQSIAMSAIIFVT